MRNLSLCGFTLAGLVIALQLQAHAQRYMSDSNVKPPVTETDVRIVQRAQEILNAPEKWNREDNRRCPASATTFSIYCALVKATVEITGSFQHRGSAMQEARFVIDDATPRSKHYQHRLMGYNNDPSTTFADVQKMLRLLHERLLRQVRK